MAFPIPTELKALQTYNPACWRPVCFIVNVPEELCRTPLSVLSHTTKGFGFPAAKQLNVAEAFSGTVRTLGETYTVGAVRSDRLETPGKPGSPLFPISPRSPGGPGSPFSPLTPRVPGSPVSPNTGRPAGPVSPELKKK